MSEMLDVIERVARAICGAQGLDWDAQATAMTSGAGSDDEQDGYRHMALAAIQTILREYVIVKRTDLYGVRQILATWQDQESPPLPIFSMTEKPE